MPRPWPMAQLVTALLGVCQLKPTLVEGGDLIFTDGVIRHTLRIAKDKHDRNLFGWTVLAEDEAFRETLQKFGGIGVEIWRPAHPSRAEDAVMRYAYHWPTSKDALDDAAVEDIRAFGPAAVSFVSDRADLGRLMLAPEDVQRGRVWAHLPANTEPSRLAKALILARHVHDADLEAAALNKLQREAERDITWVPGQPYLFRQAAADWARQYGSAVDVDLNDVVRLKRRRA